MANTKNKIGGAQSTPKKTKAGKKSKSKSEPEVGGVSQPSLVDLCPEICIPSCKHHRKSKSHMIRCCMCMVWYHGSCVGEDNDYEGIWLCQGCRSLPHKVSNLTEQVSILTRELSSFHTTHQNLVRALDHKNQFCEDLRTQIDQLVDHNRYMRNKTILSDPGPSSSHTGTINQATPPQSSGTVPLPKSTTQSSGTVRLPPRSAVNVNGRNPTRSYSSVAQTNGTPGNNTRTRAAIIGTSLIRGISSNIKATDVHPCVYVHPGRNLPQIRSRIAATVRDNPDVVVLQAGSVDIRQHHERAVMTELEETVISLKQATKGTTKILLSTIPKRSNSTDDRRARMVNNHMKFMATKDRRLSIVENNNITLSDLHKDGIHLSPDGKQKLASNILAQIRNSTKPAPRPNPNQGFHIPTRTGIRQ